MVAPNSLGECRFPFSAFDFIRGPIPLCRPRRRGFSYEIGRLAVGVAYLSPECFSPAPELLSLCKLSNCPI